MESEFNNGGDGARMAVEGEIERYILNSNLWSFIGEYYQRHTLGSISESDVCNRAAVSLLQEIVTNLSTDIQQKIKQLGALDVEYQEALNTEGEETPRSDERVLLPARMQSFLDRVNPLLREVIPALSDVVIDPSKRKTLNLPVTS